MSAEDAKYIDALKKDWVDRVLKIDTVVENDLRSTSDEAVRTFGRKSFLDKIIDNGSPDSNF